MGIRHIWHSETKDFDVPPINRRLFVACLDVIREHSPNLITPDLQQLEELIRLLIDREEGKTPAWEGIRVIRERRV